MASRLVGRDGAFEVVHPSDVLDDGYATIVPDVSSSAKIGLTDKIATGVADYLEGKTDRDIRRGRITCMFQNIYDLLQAA